MSGEVRELPVSRGLVALVDADVYEWAAALKWSANLAPRTTGGTFYVARSVRRADGRWTTSYLHREVLGVSDRRVLTDHINGNGLDNRRENLRRASKAENARNRPQHHPRNASGYRGVSWDAARQRWVAMFWVAGHQRSLGRHDTAEAAALAYDAAAREHYGEYATLNFPDLAAGERGIDREDT